MKLLPGNSIKFGLIIQLCESSAIGRFASSLQGLKDLAEKGQNKVTEGCDRSFQVYGMLRWLISSDFTTQIMIPSFDENGNLPPGIHWADWSEFKQRFGTTPKRMKMIQGLRKAMQQLKAAGCRTIYINGSFVTKKTAPGDFDACWDREEVDIDFLKINAPTLVQIYNPLAQKALYQGEIYPSDQPVDDDGKMSIDFFQLDRKQNIKGIVAIDLVRWDDD